MQQARNTSFTMPVLTITGIPAVMSKPAAQTGLPYFDRAAVTAIGCWWRGSALELMGAKLSFCYRSVNIA